MKLYSFLLSYLLSITQLPTHYEITAPNLNDDTIFCYANFVVSPKQTYYMYGVILIEVLSVMASHVKFNTHIQTGSIFYDKLKSLKKLHSNNSTTKVNKTAVLCHGSLSD